jgi:hypothetical protein
MPSKKKPSTSSARSIQEDTSIIPEAVAESVVCEANALLDWNIEEDIRSDIIGYLSGYAEAVYANNSGFRKKIRSEADNGNAGRDCLCAYMRHWLSAELLKSCPADDAAKIRRILVSSGFSMGHEIH